MAITIIYDGDCIFCRSFVRYSKLKKAAGPVTLISARDDNPLVDRVKAQGYNLDAGFVVIRGWPYLPRQRGDDLPRKPDGQRRRAGRCDPRPVFEPGLGKGHLSSDVFGARLDANVARILVHFRRAIAKQCRRNHRARDGVCANIALVAIATCVDRRAGEPRIDNGAAARPKPYDFFAVVLLLGMVTAVTFLCYPRSAGRIYRGLSNLRLPYVLAYLAAIVAVTNLFESVYP